MAKTKDWRNLPIEKWTNTTFHEYLKDMNREKYDVEYVPFGKGSVGQRWSIEKRNLRLEIEKNGPEVIKRYIDKCFETHRFNPKFPCLSFGFMYSYKRNELAAAQREVSKEKKYDQYVEESSEVDEDWF